MNFRERIQRAELRRLERNREARAEYYQRLYQYGWQPPAEARSVAQDVRLCLRAALVAGIVAWSVWGHAWGQGYPPVWPPAPMASPTPNYPMGVTPPLPPDYRGTMQVAPEWVYADPFSKDGYSVLEGNAVRLQIPQSATPTPTALPIE